ncbi:YdbH family protein [Providencia alcalifaciens]|uniref:YdbH family protein n=2 Tax=Providencia TaxID=586 RepID=UPI002962F38B|nr:YdbH family protein [Providencia rettgeri]HEM8138013.1 YdbH family protein [Providencia rettgeri]HEM8141609.1 YdbH family protein [Providencia rettgeri]
MQLLKRAFMILLCFSGVSIALLALLWITISRWAPVVASHYLPEPLKLSFSTPRIIEGQLQLSEINLNVDKCKLVEIKNTRVSIFPLHFIVDNLTVAPECFSAIKSSSHGTDDAINVEQLIGSIPEFSLVIKNVDVHPWEDYQGSLWLRSSHTDPLKLDFRGDNLQLTSLITADNQLVIQEFSTYLPEQKQTLELSGEIQLPLTANRLPEKGELNANFKLLNPEKFLTAKFSWGNNKGKISVVDIDKQQEILHLPWVLTPEVIQISDGKWQWNEADIPLKGGINLQVNNWNNILSEMVFSGRINLLTQGKKGKANLVLTLPPTHIDLINTAVNFQLNGRVKYEDMILDINLPAQVSGELTAAKISFLSGSLLRAYGRASPTVLIKEIRLPLAGTSLSEEGISGPLQAILKVKEQYWGDFDIHLDGKANKFTLDNGTWFWNYWGNAVLPSISANWDIKGNGSWQDTLITLNNLTTGFNQIHYGLLSMSAPRLQLTKPLSWQRDLNKANFKGSLQLTSERMQFGKESYLPKITVNADINGKSPADFQLKGDLSTKDVGPIVIFSRWDGERLRGEARWPEQSVTAFQTLIPADLGIELKQGKLFSQAAFSITPEDGFIAGGHWRVENTSLWLKDGDLSGLNFVLPWRLKQSTWTLGGKTPVELRIKQLNNLFELTDIKADLSGSYPPTDSAPLKLTNVGFKTLGGNISMDLLRWPQTQASTIKLRQIELSQLFTILKVSQFAVSGKVNGELPFYLNNPEWIVKNGWMENSGPLTLRLDTQFVDSIREDNISAGSAMSWLQYLEIQRSRTDVNITNLGMLTMKTILEGYNTQEKKRREVHLNYHHEENIFQLWRSLRFGSSLEEWLEKNL